MVVAFPYHADNRFEQRMTGTDIGRNWLLVDMTLVEADPFISFLNRCPRADLTITIPDDRGDTCNLPAAILTPLDLTAEVLKCIDKKALDVMGLQPLCFGFLHIKSQLANTALWHDIAG